MSLSPNPNTPIEEDDPTRVIEPTSPDALPGGDTDASIIDTGPADPRPETEPGEEFDPTVAPHFL